MGTDLYPTSSASSIVSAATNSGLWPLASSGTEIDLRDEFYSFLYGGSGETAKGQTGILRRMRSDSNGELIECSCVDPKTHEADIDTPCPYCDSEGYLWDEELLTSYKMELSSNEGFVRKDQHNTPGVINIPYAFFYVEYNVDPSRSDKIIEVARDLDGNVTYPYNRTIVHTIATTQPFRSDNGRVEYWRLACTQNSVQPRWRG